MNNDIKLVYSIFLSELIDTILPSRGIPFNGIVTAQYILTYQGSFLFKHAQNPYPIVEMLSIPNTHADDQQKWMFHTSYISYNIEKQ